MPIAVGDRLPDVTFQMMTADGPSNRTTADVFGGRKVALLAVPGAFTPTCSAQHLPGFLANVDAFKAAGVDAIVCVSVNDAFVMGEWAKHQNVGDRVEMLADGGGAFAAALGLTLQTGDFGGARSTRYSMFVDDGVAKVINIEQGGAFEVSGAEQLLQQIQQSA